MKLAKPSSMLIKLRILIFNITVQQHYCYSIWFSLFCLGELLSERRAYLHRTTGHFSFLNKMFAWVWLSILQSRNSAESVNPGTLCDGGVLRAQHSPLWGRLLFIPVMSILLGISASLHTTCCAQQCGEARASRVVVSVCQSQSQGSVSSHHSEKPYPDVACLPSLPPHTIHFPLFAVWAFCLYRS